MSVNKNSIPIIMVAKNALMRIFYFLRCTFGYHRWDYALDNRRYCADCDHSSDCGPPSRPR